MSSFLLFGWEALDDVRTPAVDLDEQVGQLL